MTPWLHMMDLIRLVVRQSVFGLADARHVAPISVQLPCHRWDPFHAMPAWWPIAVCDRTEALNVGF